MKPSYLLDTNIIVRFFVKDHEEHYQKASGLFTRAEDGFCQLILTPWIVAETIFTMVSRYKADKKEVAAALVELIRSGGISTLDGDIVLDALKRFKEKSVSFIDALLAAQSVAMQIQPVSFDSDMDKFGDIRCFRL